MQLTIVSAVDDRIFSIEVGARRRKHTWPCRSSTGASDESGSDSDGSSRSSRTGTHGVCGGGEGDAFRAG